MSCPKCFFLDVGQGSSQIITFGNNQAIVIDCGPSSSKTAVPLAVLQHLKVRRVEALVLSHNDSDHMKGATTLLQTYRGNIGKIFFPCDRDVHQAGFHSLMNFLVKECENKHLQKSQITRLERCDGPPTLLWPPPGETSDDAIELALLYPDMMSNLGALSKKHPNSSSGIMNLTIARRRRVLFTGDAPLAAWESIPETDSTLYYDILTVPHHGGQMLCTEEQLIHFYTEMVRAKYAIVSTGTGNRHGHPLSAVIRTISNSNITVLCTQVTRACCDAKNLDAWRDARGRIREISDSRPVHTRLNKVACSGTIVAEFHESETIIRDFDRMERTKERIFSNIECTPLCRECEV